MLDLDGRLVSANPHFDALLGYPTPPVRGSPLAELFVDADRSAIEDALRVAAEGTSRTLRARRRAEGAPVARIVLSPETDGERPRLLALVEDAASEVEDFERDHRATQAALAATRAQLHAAEILGRIGHWSFDLEAQRVTWSDQVFRLFDRDPALGPPDYEENMACYLPADRARLEASVRQVLEDGQTAEGDHTIRLPSGELRHHTSSIEARRDATGRIVSIHGTVQDITSRKEAENQVRELAAELERRVAERTDALRAANADLRAFSYTIAHDLRAPLRAVDGFRAALEEDFGALLPPEGHAHLDRIREAASRMSRMIDELLSLAKVSGQELARAPVSLSAIAEDVIAALRLADPARAVDVTIEPDLDVDADPELLAIALRNLLENAWKFTAPRPRARIALRRHPPGGFVVEDDGVGFDGAHSSQLFGVFRRLHTQDEFPGTGIGLATVRRIVERHGGQIRAEAELDRGARFYFTIEPEGIA